MTNESDATTPAVPNAGGWGAGQRFGGLFVSPVEAFRAIVRAPDILPPLVALIAVSVIAYEVILRKIGIVQLIRTQLELSGRASAMTAQQMQQAISTASKYAPIVGRFIALVSMPIFILIIALIGMAIMKGIFGLHIGLKTAYSVATYAWLPWLISGILTIVVVLLGDPSAFNFANPAPTSLGFFLSQQSVARPLYAAASSIDIFSFWTMALLGVGFSEATGRKTRPWIIFLCFFGLWVIWVLIHMGLAAL